MPLRLREGTTGRVLEVYASGRLRAADYLDLAPLVDRLVKEHGKLRLLLDLSDFRGWTAGAAWEDLKFDLRHFRDVDRVAIVGDATWERLATELCKPFTRAIVRYFDRTASEAARAWLGAIDGTPIDPAG